MLFPGPYRVPRAGFSTKSIYTNTVGRTAYRGPWQFETLAREVLLDIAAREMGIDPVELRRRNVLRRDELPYTNPNGMPYDNISPTRDVGAGARAARLRRVPQGAGRGAQRRPLPRRRRVQLRRAVDTGHGLLRDRGRDHPHRTLRRVNVYIAGGSTGNSIETTVVQLAADALGANIEDVNTIQGDTALTGFGAGAAGSRSGSMTAGAIRDTATILRERLVRDRRAQARSGGRRHRVGREPRDVRGTPSIGISLREIATLAYFEPFSLPPGVPAGLEASARYTAEAPIIWVNATHVCTCEVDVETGGVTLLRYIVSEDCGPMINPSVVEGQIAGGVVQGIGGALFEDLAVDDDGNPLATTFMDYLVPSAAEVPMLEFGHIETPSPGPGGYKGVGEGGAIGAPRPSSTRSPTRSRRSACAVTRLPVSPARIVALLQDASE